MIRLAFTVDEAARALGLGRSTTYRLVKEGKIPTVRLGGRILVPVHRLSEMVERKARP